MVLAEDDLAIVLPRPSRRLSGGQDGEEALDLLHRLAGQLLRVRHQHGRRVVAVLGLAEEVGGAHLGIDRLVGDDHGLGRPGEEIDADPPEELPLGLGDIGVAGADQHVDGLDRLRPERHRAHRLDAAQTVDLVRAAHVHRRDDGRVGRALEGRRGGGDPRHAGDLRRHHRHVRARPPSGTCPPARSTRPTGLGCCGAPAPRPAASRPRCRSSRRVAPRRSGAPELERSGCRPCPARTLGPSAPRSRTPTGGSSRARSRRTWRTAPAPPHRRGPRCRRGYPRRWRGPSRRPYRAPRPCVPS